MTQPNSPPAGPKQGEPQEQFIVATVPGRLAVATRRKTLPQTVRDGRHQRVAEIAADWQQVSAHADFWELGGIVRGAPRDWASALTGQMAAGGEQLGLAFAAAVEVALWREFRKRHEMGPEHEMGMRAMGETQCYFVMGAGHALANVAVRALGFSANLRTALQDKFTRAGRRPTFKPFSDKQEDWVDLNETTARTLRRVARDAGSPAVVTLIEPVATFAKGSAWRELTERRGEDFHRWRPQSHGIRGVSKKSRWKVEGSTASLSGGGNPEYADAKELAEETSRAATAAMLALADAMDSFDDAWPAASGPLGGPKFRTT